MQGLARLDLGDLSGLEDLREALDLSVRLGLGIETGTSYLNLGEMTAAVRDIPSGLELVDTSLEFARSRGLTHHEMWSRSARLWLLYVLGEWDELLREAPELLAWDQDRGGTQIGVNVLMTSAPARAQRGSVGEAVRDVAIFLPRARQIADPQTLAPALTSAAFVVALDGRLDEAVALAREFEHATRERPSWRASGLAPLVRVCAAAGELSLAGTLLEGASSTTRSHSGDGAVATARAIIAETSGDPDAAGALYRDAVRHWTSWGSVVERGYAQLGVARCTGDEDALAEASAIFERLRAVPFTALAA
jgi:hypothetical protein